MSETKNWKETIENNLTFFIVGLCVVTASVSAGVINWMWSRESALIELQHQAEVTEIENQFVLEVNDLRQRIVSIERRVGGKNLLLDVSAIPISPEDLPAIGQSHNSYSDSLFFVAPPVFGDWIEKPASQLDFLEFLLGEGIQSSFSGLLSEFDAMTNKVGMIWSSIETISAKLAPDASVIAMADTDVIVTRPIIYAMHINKKFLNDTAEVAQFLVEGMFDLDDDVDIFDSPAKLKLVQEINTENTISEKTGSNSDNTYELEKKELFVEILDDLSRDDLAGYTMLDALASNTNMAMLFGGTLSVTSAQKKGNVMYLRLNTKIPTIQENNSTETLLLDQEYFFIGASDGGVLVRSVVPSISFNNPDAYTWTQSWLSSLRIPIQ